VHVLSYSTEHPYTPGTPQHAFMEADLARADAARDRTPWLLVTGHRPFYCSEPGYCVNCGGETEPAEEAVAFGRGRGGGVGGAEDRVQALEPLLLKYKVRE
jgi:hypothetical protein